MKNLGLESPAMLSNLWGPTFLAVSHAACALWATQVCAKKKRAATTTTLGWGARHLAPRGRGLRQPSPATCMLLLCFSVQKSEGR